jgi:chorismate synthase
MSANSYGEIFKITTFGESHGKAVGVIIDGCPAGLVLSEADIQPDLDRRRPGQSHITTQRDEKDRVEILSGVFEGKTTGTPISLIVFNQDQKSSDYDALKNLVRPGHADYTYNQKYGNRDPRGGGRSSARIMIARVAAGAIAKKFLKEKLGVEFLAYTESVGEVRMHYNSFKGNDKDAVLNNSSSLTREVSEGRRVFIPYNPELTEKANHLRKNQTEAEQLIWYNILNKYKTDYKFLRQKPLLEYIVDFYCSELRLVIEIDDESHNEKVEYDKDRTKKLEAYGLKVVRYTNNEVKTNLDGVKLSLEKVISELVNSNPQSLQDSSLVREQLEASTQDEFINKITQAQIEANIVRCPDPETAEKMIKLIEQVRKDEDSIGGVIRGLIRNVPVGLGEPEFDKLPAELAKAMMSINATKGFEIGSGFEGTKLRGSQHNDIFYTDENGNVKTKTNHAGGVLGGISSGQTIDFRVAIKPVATISQAQDTIDKDGKKVVVEGKGRHDPCVLPRAVPIVEAMAALVIMDMYLRNRASDNL